MKPTYPNLRLFCILGILGMMLAACSPSHALMESDRSALTSQGIDIRDVQFYTDMEIIMRRESDNRQTQISNGEIKQKDGLLTEEVRIPRGTPGLVDSVADQTIWVSFENRRNSSLRFSKNSYDLYQLDADEWLEGSGKIDYGGKTFYLTPGYHNALLMVKRRDIYKSEKRGRVAKGRKLDTTEEKKPKRKKIRRKDLKRVDPESPEEDDEDLWDEGYDDGAFEE